jgi:hypothetical protein
MAFDFHDSGVLAKIAILLEVPEIGAKLVEGIA